MLRIGIRRFSTGSLDEIYKLGLVFAELTVRRDWRCWLRKLVWMGHAWEQPRCEMTIAG